jgi:putative heme-binding domain-containing protein
MMRMGMVGLSMGLLVSGSMARGARDTAASADEKAQEIQTLPGFKVETVIKADKEKHGTWISMAWDDKGRILLAGARKEPITRLTLENGKVTKDEQLKIPLSECMGMLYAFGNLYIDGNDGKIFGLWRCKPDGNDGWSKPELLHEWPRGAGDHGAHAIVLSPDKKSLFIVCGNFTGVPEQLAPTSPHKNFADDLVLPRAEDGNGFGAGNKPPGGFIVKTDPDAKHFELFAAGFRNTYDIGFNPDGELFLFDSDMEWDWGTAWYRPIRVIHAVSGGDYGFREGTGKWPAYYPDSLPPAVDIGLGSPTGVISGAGAKFPAKYQKAFYVLDWTYGRLIAAHLKPHGSSYTAEWENFIAPKGLHSDSGKTPLNLTDALIGSDGAMYFSIGGRGTQSYLFRVTYTGSESTAPADLHDAAGADQREIRHQLEAFHGHENPAAVQTAWKYLGSSDRFLRYAARIAIESQPVVQWKDKALSETDAQASLTALLAVARLGSNEDQPALFKALARMPIAALTPEQQLEKLRVIEVSIARHGKPTTEVAASVIHDLDPFFPGKTFELNRELSQILLALDAPGAVAKTVGLLNSARYQEEQTAYILALRTIKNGWTNDLRREYFAWWAKDHSLAQHPAYVLKWFEEAGRPYGDGASFHNFIAHLHDDAEETLTPQEHKSLKDVLAAFVAKPGKPRKGKAAGPTKFVKEWKMADLEPVLAQASHGRNFERGQALFEDAAQCLACHKFGSEGGSVGPDLTAVSSRFNRHDILESIILPSKVISDQYANMKVRFKEGGGVIGRIVEETNDHIIVQPSMLSPEKVTVSKADIANREVSTISPMPEGLVNNLTKADILDLLAYVESGGKKDHPDFRK